MKRWRQLALLLASSAVLQVNATPTDDGSCRNGNFPLLNNTFTLATVTGKPNVYLLKDMDGCPLKGEAMCRQRAYVIEGDTLLSVAQRAAIDVFSIPIKREEALAGS
ncbi:hypothetical protein [Burkholderia cepacia]|uniref:hypothetical protein n=1 Tax=Burkholderia cepacia TaxID=292 RepID=UPI001C9E1195|nr:hypothetical protein [Burkholderia cepacia]